MKGACGNADTAGAGVARTAQGAGGGAVPTITSSRFGITRGTPKMIVDTATPDSAKWWEQPPPASPARGAFSRGIRTARSSSRCRGPPCGCNRGSHASSAAIHGVTWCSPTRVRRGVTRSCGRVRTAGSSRTRGALTGRSSTAPGLTGAGSAPTASSGSRTQKTGPPCTAGSAAPSPATDGSRSARPARRMTRRTRRSPGTTRARRSRDCSTRRASRTSSTSSATTAPMTAP